MQYLLAIVPDLDLFFQNNRSHLNKSWVGTDPQVGFGTDPQIHHS